MGTRCTEILRRQGRRDHPHACGDKVNTVTVNLQGLGSSPRVWGQAKKRKKNAKEARIIPTRVGTSRGHGQAYDGNEDHPHACGDKPQHPRPFICKVGSSPRVWGQVGLLEIFKHLQRIIPTRVGTSSYGAYGRGKC